jgi:hypothetical protein
LAENGAMMMHGYALADNRALAQRARPFSPSMR